MCKKKKIKKDIFNRNKEYEAAKNSKVIAKTSKKKPKTSLSRPKKAWPAFFFYQKQRRESMRKEFCNIEYSVVVNKLEEEWRNLSDEDKRIFIEMSDKDNLRYTKEMEEYEKLKSQIDHHSKENKEKEGKILIQEKFIRGENLFK